jgi:hypothetical protein
MSNIRPITGSEAVSEMEARILAVAGKNLGPVKIRMKSATQEDAELRQRTNTEVITTGYDHARKAILSGVAELVE